MSRLLRSTVAVALLALGSAALAQGRVASVDLLDRIQPGVTTADEVRQLLGKPGRTQRHPREGVEVMEYYGRDFGDLLVIQVAITGDGKVRDVRKFKPNTP